MIGLLRPLKNSLLKKNNLTTRTNKTPLVYVITTDFDVYLNEINQLNMTILSCLNNIIVSGK